ncbi:PREDICTED: PCNA-associated factor-like [Polistes canadensis]|uniref:PCNA-associated factor-like n=1 Tax=Polistes canadensis TaxID=91411 RepID=UPI000718E3B5|nr:PREDICTED: PCNA-associated factor-like [Polistes canadensis]
MVRTKADRLPAKAVGAKAPHKLSSTTDGVKKTGNNKVRGYTGGNPYHPRQTPNWQKPITNFMNQSITNTDNVASSSNDNENEENQSDTSIVEND